jgi:hypothetical protein
MSQNLIQLSLSDTDYGEIDAALTPLEQALSGLIDMDASERRGLAKMGDKSEAFCRQTLRVMAQKRRASAPRRTMSRQPGAWTNPAVAN